MSSFRIWAEWLRRPTRERFAFLQAGEGMRRRGRRLHRYWRDHWEQTRAEQRLWAASASGRCPLWIVGAGSLHDADLSALSHIWREIVCLDADPLARREWSRTAARLPPGSTLHGVVAEASGRIAHWSRQLEDALKAPIRNADERWLKALAVLEALPAASPPPSPLFTSAGAILSLNLLSQIPIFWQDLVSGILHRWFPESARTRDQEWLTAIQPSCRLLVQDHLHHLFQSGASDILLITDVEYLHYSGSGLYSKRGFRLPPLEWNEESKWSQIEPGVTVSIEPALYGVNLETANAWPDSASRYRLTRKHSWLWHISPLGLESRVEGTIHRIASSHWRSIF